MHLILNIVDGEVIEKTVSTNSCTIGRSTSCDVVVPNDGMSRQHCQIEHVNGEIFITDLGSTNGVLIDGKKIEPHKKTPYQTFLTLSFGPVQSAQVVIEESARPSPTATGTRKLRTRTKDITRPASSAPKRTKEESTNQRSLFLLGLLILALATLWYLYKNEPTHDVSGTNPAELYE